MHILKKKGKKQFLIFSSNTSELIQASVYQCDCNCACEQENSRKQDKE
jgi:hypothetical protein